MLIIAFALFLLALRAFGLKNTGRTGDVHGESYMPKHLNRRGELVRWNEPY